MTKTPERHEILKLYDQLKKKTKKSLLDPAVSQLIDSIVVASKKLLKDQTRQNLVSKVEGKEYFAFQTGPLLQGKKRSRAVNRALFVDGDEGWRGVRERMKDRTLDEMDPIAINRELYSAAIAFCAAVDLIKKGDQQTPGTFFGIFVAHLFAWQAEVEPERGVRLVGLEEGEKKKTLPTDYRFSLGPNRPRLHLPVKTSSRERGIMFWAHQKLLDGLFGIGTFLGVPVLLAETKTADRTDEVTEICTPDQWLSYQKYIARVKRIYCLDVPAKNKELAGGFPPVVVKPLGSLFTDWDDLVSGL